MGKEHAYLMELTARLQRVLSANLMGVYAGGSYALGGYETGRSDLDVAAVVREPLGEDAVKDVVAAVRHEALACPARKLELVVYTKEAARSSSPAAPFVLNLNTGKGEPFRLDTELQAGERHWFGIDRSVLAQDGIALVGPPATEVFTSPIRADLLSLLAGVLRWYEEHEPDGEDALLNAGRSLRFARDGIWLPKTEVRDWAGTAGEDALKRAIAELDELSRGAA